MKTLIVCAALAVVLICSDATPLKQNREFISKTKLIRGRPWHGLVPKPDTDPKAAKSAAYYFTAKVDNFDPSNTKTYQQVSFQRFEKSVFTVTVFSVIGTITNGTSQVALSSL